MNRGSLVLADQTVQRDLASMRPRFMNRGSYFIGHVRRLDAVASMRPRFMNRGSETKTQDAATPVPASMRPRFMNRGSRKVRRRCGADMARFNEAPIHESGKCETRTLKVPRPLALQ